MYVAHRMRCVQIKEKGRRKREGERGREEGEKKREREGERKREERGKKREGDENHSLPPIC